MCRRSDDHARCMMPPTIMPDTRHRPGGGTRTHTHYREVAITRTICLLLPGNGTWRRSMGWQYGSQRQGPSQATVKYKIGAGNGKRRTRRRRRQRRKEQLVFQFNAAVLYCVLQEVFFLHIACYLGVPPSVPCCTRWCTCQRRCSR